MDPQHDTPEPDEQDLVARIRTGDVGAYEQLYRRYYRRLCEFATHYVKSFDDAHDIVSDVFAVVWERRMDWTPERAGTYLFGAVRNRALNVIRATQTNYRLTAEWGPSEASGLAEPAGAPDSGVEASSERHWRLGTFREALTVLSERQRTVLILRWRFQKGWDEIARTLGISVPAAQMDHSRALQIIRGQIKRR